MWNLNKGYKRTYLQNRNRVTDVENKLIVTKGEIGGGGINWEMGTDIYTLLYIREITNRPNFSSEHMKILSPTSHS